MRITTSRSLGTALVAVGLLAAGPPSTAQTPDAPGAEGRGDWPGAIAERARSDPRPDDGRERLRDLIASRSGENWDRFRIDTTPTPPPGAPPVRVLAEWEPATSALLAIDSDYALSIELNILFKTTDRAGEVLAAAPELVEELEQDPATSGKAREMISRLGRAHCLIRTINALRSHVPVLVIIKGDADDQDLVPTFLAELGEFPEAEGILGDASVRFATMPLDTKWVRDYGPLFAADAEGRIHCLDSRYDPEREAHENQAWLQKIRRAFRDARKESGGATDRGLGKMFDEDEEASGEGPQAEAEDEPEEPEEVDRSRDDIFNTYLASYLRQRSGTAPLATPVSVVRPPLELDGGDFLTDGRGVALTSTRTLQSNGGNVDLFGLALREYYGVEHVAYLRPLPGRTIKHIDMLVKFVSPDVLLLARFDEPAGDDEAAPLQADAARAMEYNLEILRAFYRSLGREVVVHDEVGPLAEGKVNIVRVPMPPVLRPYREQARQLEQELDAIAERHDEAADQVEPLAQAVEESALRVQEWLDNRQRLREIRDRVRRSVDEGTADVEDAAGLLGPLRSFLDELGDAPGLPDEARESLDRLAAWSAGSEDPSSAPPESVAGPELLAALDDAQMAVAIQIGALNRQRQELAEGREGQDAQVEDLEREWTRTRDRLEELRRDEAMGGDLYRTFLNAIHVRSGSDAVVLLPVYSGVDNLNSTAEDIFREVYARVYGATEVTPVLFDSLVKEYGAAHCLVRTIPGEVEVLVDDNVRSSSRIERASSEIRQQFEILRMFRKLLIELDPEEDEP